VDLGYAMYQGSTDPSTNISSFFSILFAAPPIGALWFQAPQAPNNETGIQDATSNAPQCYQALYGRIGSKLRMPAKGLRVIVFIHSDGYHGGRASLYHQADLVTDSQNQAIAVFIQYRLGVFGNVYPSFQFCGY
ncbi:hypothetical protein PILCRDRAFT_70060, partial [Piloderma croceum F 1598]